MEFLVHWAGYDDPKEHTWEPWKHVRLVDKLHEYLLRHDLRQLIPPECRKDQEAEASRYQKKMDKRKALDETVTSRKRRKPVTDPASDVLPSDVTTRRNPRRTSTR